MTTIERGNWSHRDPGEDIPDGSTINGGNFSQLIPSTTILAGKSLVINGGNWVNVLAQPEWTINGGNWCQVSRCWHLHPDWGLPIEVENCEHVTEVDEIYIDSELVETIYHRKDAVQ